MNPNQTASKILFCLICFAFLFTSCNKDEDDNPIVPGNNEPDIILSDETVIIDTTNVSEPEIEGNNYIFTFTGNPPDIIEGDIILGQTGGGYLRKVNAVTIQGNRIILETGPATLTEAFEKLEVQRSFSLTCGDSSSGDSSNNISKSGGNYYSDGITGSDGGFDLHDVELFDAVVTQDGRTIELEISISDGRIEFNPDLDIGLQIRGFQLREFHAIAEAELICDLNLQCTASASLDLFEGNITLFPPIHFGAIPIGPLVFVPTLRFIAGYSVAIGAAGSFSTGFSFESEISIGSEYDGSDWNSIYEHDAQLARGPVRWDAEFGASITGYVKPRLSFELYTVAGPYMELEPYLRFGGVVRLRDWEWGLYGGIDANVGVSMDLMGVNLADYHLTLQNWEAEIAVEYGEFEDDPPNTPSSPNPSNGAADQSTETMLSWECSDPNGDQLTFDIYLGTSNNPSLVRDGFYGFTYDPGNLDNNETYYWKIVAHDGTGNSTDGPLWRFTTIGRNLIVVNSSPSGATIYLDGTNLEMTTPSTLTGVEAGYHHIRLYKERYNEYNEHFTLEQGGSHAINADLGSPVPPLPTFEIEQPDNNEQFDNNVIRVSGSVHLEDNNGNVTSFDGENAILNLNGVDSEIAISYGRFSENISIISGANTIRMRATSADGNTGVSDEVTVYGSFQENDIEVTLSWNTPTSDLDLHIWNPDGEHCYYGNMEITDGSLDIDDTEGFGPETFTADALEGTYVVKVNCYSLDSDDYSDATLQVRLFGELIDTYGPHRFTEADRNGSDPDAWWEVTTFSTEPGVMGAKVRPLSPQMLAKIRKDMRNLPAKD